MLPAAGVAAGGGGVDPIGSERTVGAGVEVSVDDLGSVAMPGILQLGAAEDLGM